MLKNYFKVAIRHLLRQPGYASLNILGLTLGIVSSLLVVLYLSNELSYDNYHENIENIYRISSRIVEPDNAFNWAVTQYPLGKTAREEIPEVEQYVRFISSGRTKFVRDNINYFIEDVYLVDSTVFDVFTFNFIMGDPATSLNQPNSIVLAKSESDKIFKGENPMGQILGTDNHSYTVRGVYLDQPQNSHLIARAMASSSTSERISGNQNWGGFGIYTYVTLDDKASPDSVSSRLNREIIPKYVATIFDQFDIKVRYRLINVADIHLKSDYENEPSPLGSMDYVYIFGVVAIFLIFIACINYMNLATARSMRRSLEVGIRKAMGANKKSLVGQFLSESMVIALLSMLIAIVLLIILTPLINNQLNTHLDLWYLLSPSIILTIVGMLLFIGLVSGSYPAIYLSAFQPIQAIRGGSITRAGSIWLRKVLVGIQFAISIFMLIGTVIIYDQMNFVRNADLGFDKDQLATFFINRSNRAKWDVFRNALLENPNIPLAATATSVPGEGYGKNVMTVETKEGVMEEYGVDLLFVDYDYFKTLGIEILEGRDFSYDYATDTIAAVMVNESMVSRFAWDNPIGKKFQFGSDSLPRRVIGVVKDFHHRSLYNPIDPLAFFPNLNNGNAMVKISQDVTSTMKYIEEKWEAVFPDEPFEPSFLDQGFMEEYESDQLRGKLFLGFSIMMIIIAGLGLLGLASFIAEQRSKEITIRKVLGADLPGLIFLLIGSFVWLVLAGAIPAFIAGYFIMDSWLSNFQYHVNINLILFLGVLLTVLALTIVTTGYHAYKAAVTNPSDNLRYE